MKNFGDLERAAGFFIYNRITFSGTSLSGGFSQAAFEGRFTDNSVHKLKQVAELLNETKITCLDYEELVKAEGDNVFIFLDPPYFSATKSALYGKNGNMHKSFDHSRFAENMKNCHHKWLITYDDSPYIRDLFSFANIMSWDLTYGMRNVGKNSDQIGKEVFISNYLEELPRSNQINMFDTSLIVSA
jgi:DNA adenine methylase